MSIGRYRLQRLLRRGGMGILYEAWDSKLERPVALKIVAHPLDPDACRRALREAKAVTRVRSDHVVQVFDAGEQLGCPYLVMELLTGEDLQVVMQRGPVPVRTAVDWTLQACEALAHLHHHGLVHRDVKPANLFLEARVDGSVRLKLLDFGVAKDLRREGQSHATAAGEVIGSLPYMAPEQVLDSRDVDVRTDVWGVGAILYELLAGQPPFASDTRLAAMTHITQQAHTPLYRHPLSIPDALSDVVDRCLEKERGARWPAIAELARALEPFASDSGAALIPRIEAIQSAERPLVPDLDAERAEAPSLPMPVAGVHEASDDSDTGVDFAWLGEKPGLAATVASGAGLGAPPLAENDRHAWPTRTLRALSRTAGPLLVAGAITLAAFWPSLRSIGAQRIERLEHSASHCIGSFSSYPALSMSHQVGNPRGEYWNLYTNGWVAQQHEFAAGEAEVRVSAGADLAGDDPPHMLVSVDDVVIGEVDVPSEDLTTFAFPYDASAGWHSVRVHFTNDYLTGGRDRNLILGEVLIGQCSFESAD